MARKKKQIDPSPETDSSCKTEILEVKAEKPPRKDLDVLAMGPRQYEKNLKAHAKRTKENS